MRIMRLGILRMGDSNNTKHRLFPFSVLLFALLGSILGLSAPNALATSSRPVNVTGLQIVKLDPGLKFLTLKWNSSAINQGVDKYALYMNDLLEVDQ